jgi:hypothetical protein
MTRSSRQPLWRSWRLGARNFSQGLSRAKPRRQEHPSCCAFAEREGLRQCSSVVWERSHVASSVSLMSWSATDNMSCTTSAKHNRTGRCRAQPRRWGRSRRRPVASGNGEGRRAGGDLAGVSAWSSWGRRSFSAVAISRRSRVGNTLRNDATRATSNASFLK